MLNKNSLRAEMARNGVTQKQLAYKVGISEKTFILKMKKGTFGIDEAKRIIDILQIKNPADIFFANEGT